MTNIHPTAIIEKGAELDDGAEVGAYAYIGSQARIGGGTVVAHHATVDGNTVLGRDNQIFRTRTSAEKRTTSNSKAATLGLSSATETFSANIQPRIWRPPTATIR